METIEKHITSLNSAKKNIILADHLTYVTFPVVKDNKLLLKILEEIANSLLNAINSILQYEYLYKRIHIYQNPKDNFETFLKLADKYSINQEQIKTIKEILQITENHKKSPLEFSKRDKLIILTDNSNFSQINIEKIKIFVLETKDIIRKISLRIRN